jgi:hypothetical protein
VYSKLRFINVNRTDIGITENDTKAFIKEVDTASLLGIINEKNNRKSIERRNLY